MKYGEPRYTKALDVWILLNRLRIPRKALQHFGHDNASEGERFAFLDQAPNTLDAKIPGAYLIPKG